MIRTVWGMRRVLRGERWYLRHAAGWRGSCLRGWRAGSRFEPGAERPGGGQGVLGGGVAWCLEREPEREAAAVGLFGVVFGVLQPVQEQPGCLACGGRLNGHAA